MMGTNTGAAKGKWLYIPNSMWTWSFFLVALVQAILALSLEAYVFAKFQNGLLPIANVQGGSDVKTIPTYLGLLIFGFLYQLLLVYDALRARNTIQVIGILFMNIAILVYTSIQGDQIEDAFNNLRKINLIYDQFWSDVKPYLIALPIITAVGSLILTGIAWKLYEEFAWTIYKQISADVRMKNRFLLYQIYIALLKFDFFLFLGFVIQFLIIVHNTSDAEFYLTVAALPVILVLLLLAAWSTKRESIIGMALTILVYFVALSYFIFKLVRMYNADKQRREEYLPARKTLTLFAVVTIVFLVVTIITACWCTHNFNKGLKPHISKSSRMKEEMEGTGGHQKFSMGDVEGQKYSDISSQGGNQSAGWPPGGANAGPNRMEID